MDGDSNLACEFKRATTSPDRLSNSLRREDHNRIVEYLPSSGVLRLVDWRRRICKAMREGVN